MEHTDAVRTNAVERYLLDEMSEEERAIFEEHFFECGHCVAAINAGTQLMIAGRAVAREAENVVPFRKRWRWVPQAAAASLLLMIGTQLPRVVPALRPVPAITADALRGYDPVPVETGQLRGDPADIPVTRMRPGGAITVDVKPPDPLALSYVARLKDSRDKLRSEVPISLEQATESVPLLLGELPAGSYVLVIESAREGGKRYEIARSVIEVGERD